MMDALVIHTCMVYMIYVPVGTGCQGYYASLAKTRIKIFLFMQHIANTANCLDILMICEVIVGMSL